MRTIGNLVWLVFAGLWLAIGYAVGGAVLCATVVGIPFGIQAFKLAGLALWPFGREVHAPAEPAGCVTTAFNVVWLVLFGWEIFLASLVSGLILCATLVGIPFGVQAVKLGVLALWPFGRSIRRP
jgi:uncharacterized membrane protein YccF (DUF307 family)